MTDPCAPVQVTQAEGSARDLDAVMAVMNTAFDPCYGEAWTRSQCAGILGLPGVWLLIARDQAHLPALGFALSRAIVDEAELLLLAVAPAQRRRGVGRALIDEVMVAARSRGAARLHLEMRANNPAAALYQTVGFAQVGRRARYYMGSNGERFDAVTLAVELRADP